MFTPNIREGYTTRSESRPTNWTTQPIPPPVAHETRRVFLLSTREFLEGPRPDLPSNVILVVEGVIHSGDGAEVVCGHACRWQPMYVRRRKSHSPDVEAALETKFLKKCQPMLLNWYTREKGRFGETVLLDVFAGFCNQPLDPAVVFRLMSEPDDQSDLSQQTSEPADSGRPRHSKRDTTPDPSRKYRHTTPEPQTRRRDWTPSSRRDTTPSRHRDPQDSSPSSTHGGGQDTRDTTPDPRRRRPSQQGSGSTTNNFQPGPKNESLNKQPSAQSDTSGKPTGGGSRSDQQLYSKSSSLADMPSSSQPSKSNTEGPKDVKAYKLTSVDSQGVRSEREVYKVLIETGLTAPAWYITDVFTQDECEQLMKFVEKAYETFDNGAVPFCGISRSPQKPLSGVVLQSKEKPDAELACFVPENVRSHVASYVNNLTKIFGGCLDLPSSDGSCVAMFVEKVERGVPYVWAVHGPANSKSYYHVLCPLSCEPSDLAQLQFIVGGSPAKNTVGFTQGTAIIHETRGVVAEKLVVPFAEQPPGAAPGVVQTGEDSVASKWSTMTKSYFDYPELEYFVAERRTREALINRGYFTRVRAVRTAILKFCDVAGEPIQVVNLGCGLDPLYYWFQNATVGRMKATHRFTYYEVDYPSVLRDKASIIRKVPELAVRAGANGVDSLVMSDTYRMISCDLSATSELVSKFMNAGFDPLQPTCFVLECVLTYLPADAADALIRTLTSWTKNFMIINYDMFNVRDKFGCMMKYNLAQRQCDIESTARFETVASIITHMKSLVENKEKSSPPSSREDSESCEAALDGVAVAKNTFKDQYSPCEVHAIDMNTFWESSIPVIDKFRVEQLELFDELEEWRLIQAHYFVGLICRLKGQPFSVKREGACLSSAIFGDGQSQTAAQRARPRFRTEDLRCFGKEEILAKAAERIYDDEGGEDANGLSRELLRVAGVQRWLHTPCVYPRYYSAPTLACAEETQNHRQNDNSPKGGPFKSSRSSGDGHHSLIYTPLQSVAEDAEPTTLGAYLQTR